MARLSKWGCSYSSKSPRCALDSAENRGPMAMRLTAEPEGTALRRPKKRAAIAALFTQRQRLALRFGRPDLLGRQFGIERVGARDRGLRQHVLLHGAQRILAGERAVQVQAVHVQRV